MPFYFKLTYFYILKLDKIFIEIKTSLNTDSELVILETQTFSLLIKKIT